MKEQWKGFRGGNWCNKPDVKDFIQNNYKSYEGDNSFLETATDKTSTVWNKCLDLLKEELKKGVLDIDARIDNCETILPARESEVLLRLCRDAGTTVNTSALLKELWGDDNYFNLRSLNVYITRLRNHFKTDHTVEIESVRGIGYKLKC